MLCYGLAFVLISYLSTTSSNKFELVTDQDFSDEILNYSLFFGSVLANYSGFYLLWRFSKNKLTHYYLIITGLFVIIGGLLNVNWLLNIAHEVQETYNNISFPNDVDLITVEIKKSIIHKNAIFFGMLSTIGLCSVLLASTHLKHAN